MKNVWLRPISGIVIGLSFSYLFAIDTVFVFIIVFMSGVLKADYNLVRMLQIDLVLTYMIIAAGVHISYSICRIWYLTISIIFALFFSVLTAFQSSVSEASPLWYLTLLYTGYIVLPLIIYKSRKYTSRYFFLLNDKNLFKFIVCTLFSMVFWPLFTVDISGSSWLIPLKITLLFSFLSGFLGGVLPIKNTMLAIGTSVLIGSFFMFVFCVLVIFPYTSAGVFKMG